MRAIFSASAVTLSLFALVWASVTFADTGNLPIPKPAPERPSDITETTEEADTSKTGGTGEPSAHLPTDGDTRQCEAKLAELGVSYEIVEPVVGDTGCGVKKPFNVSEIAPGITVQPDTQLRCHTVLALAKWIDRTVLPAAGALRTQSDKQRPIRLTSIRHGSTYVCRRRNNLPTSKLSEHAKGNAIDIVGFEFDGRTPLSIEPRERTGSIEEAFQRAVRAGACLDFTTVLGPGADAFHDDHLHLDIAERSSGYRLCR